MPSRIDKSALPFGLPLMGVAYLLGAPMGIAFAAYALAVITDLLGSRGSA
jgi:hypothetical protein